MICWTLIGNITIVIGALIFATAALGVLRFPDAYMRVSAVGTAGGKYRADCRRCPSHPAFDSERGEGGAHFGCAPASSAVGTMAIARATYITRTPLEHFELR